MLSVQQAENIIFDHKIDLAVPTIGLWHGVTLIQSLGRVLAEDLVADRDFPPFDRVTMDGIAIRFENFKNGQTPFKIEGIQAAGMPQLILPNHPSPISNHPSPITHHSSPIAHHPSPIAHCPSPIAHYPCFEVMTGAMLPIGCDTVIRYEDLKIENGVAEILTQTIDYQQNIHKKGVDRKAQDVLVLRGCLITAAEIATAATVGKTEVQVVRLPKTAIISTGDELVEVSETPLPHQIRRSNVFAIQAMLATLKIEPQLFHFNDDETAITAGLKTILNEYDLVILSGAVSEGKFDFVPKVMDNLGVEKLFHKVAQRPGKPFWFGIKQATENHAQTMVFALPGNPVSTFLCAYRYVLPYVKSCLGLNKIPQEYAVLSENVVFKPDLTYFLQVKLQNTEGVLWAKPIAGGGSGDLANLNNADGFLELPQGRDLFEKGEMFPLIRYR